MTLWKRHHRDSGQAESGQAEKRMSMAGSLGFLRDLGFSPATVFDVGAQIGTGQLYETFPNAHHVLIEPVEENIPQLESVRDRLSSAEIIVGAASDRVRTAKMMVSSDKMYALFRKSDDPGPEGWSVREDIDVITMNSLVEKKRYSKPFLLKIDVDGAEVSVLRGATDLLQQDTVLIVECTLVEINPRFKSVIDFLYEKEFVVFDIVEPRYRPKDNAMWQVDLVFVHAQNSLREAGPFK